jgi:hypothetical protein
MFHTADDYFSKKFRRRSGPLPVTGPFRNSKDLIKSLTEAFNPGDRIIVNSTIIDPFKDKQLEKGSQVTVLRSCSDTGHLICRDTDKLLWAVPTKYASLVEGTPPSGLRGRYKIIMDGDEDEVS